MPPLPVELQSSCDALYIYECQQAGLSISDLEKLSYSFVNDAIAYADDDEESRNGETSFWA